MEKSLFTKTAKILGTPTSTCWAQVFSQEASDEKSSQTRGKLFAVLEIKASDDFQAAIVGHDAWDKLAANYFNQEGAPFEVLESSVNLAVDEIKAEMAGFESSSKDNWQLSVAAAVLWGKIMYLAVVGKSSVQLLRDRQLKTILTGAVWNFARPSSVLTASGYVNKDDLFIISSSGFNQLIDEQALTEVAVEKELNEVVEIITPRVHSLPDSSQIAALLIKLELVEKLDLKEEEIVIVDSEQPREKIWVKLLTRFVTFRNRLFKFKTSVERPLYVGSSKREVRKHRLVLLVLISLSFLLIISITFTIIQRSRSAKLSKFNSLYSEVERLYKEGEDLLSINPGEARSSFQKASELLNELKGLSLNKGKVSELEEKIASGLANSLQKVEVGAAATFLDLNLVRSGTKATKLSGYDDKLVFWDENGKSLVIVEGETKSAQIVAGGDELSGFVNLAAASDFGYLLTDNGIWRVDLKNRTKSKVIEKSDKWGSISDIYTYAGNIYLLDQTNHQVHKYTAAQTGYEPRLDFITAEGRPDFSKAISLTIDGVIWVVTGEGYLYKIMGGRAELVQITGIDKPMRPVAIDGDERSSHLYILDPSNNRVVVLTKDGRYWSQYISADFSQATDLKVFEPEKRMFLLSASKIFLVNLSK
ncbi:MAG: hypothetical protein QW303_07470 [Nitrososphaerota archaeon]